MLSLQLSIRVEDLGLIPYAQAYARQKQCVNDLLRGGPPTLLVCEHPAVLTLGRLASHGNFLVPREDILKRGIEIVDIDRGGEVTLHSPGQLVLYPILNLKEQGQDLKRYLWRLEQVGIDFLKEFAILADRNFGRTGVWVGPRKIASVGIGVRRWVSYHGMAININTDLELFSLIKPCGLDVQMTSVATIQGAGVDMTLAKQRLSEVFCREFADRIGMGYE